MGKGSTFSFTVRLPLAKELPAGSEAPAAVTPAACAPLRILLVEDNPANQKLATYILHDRGHAVEIAGNGQEAIYLAEHNRYDVILMDVQMPEMDGLEATAAIRAREYAGHHVPMVGEGSGKGVWSDLCEAPSGPFRQLGPDPVSAPGRVPIIAMTAHSMKGDREQCLAAGMDAYISKPIKRDELIETVERLAAAGDFESQISNLKSQISDFRFQISDLKLRIDDPGPGVPGSPKAEDLTPDSSPFNLDAAMEQLGGERELFRQMVRFFFSDGLKLLPEIRAAAGAGDATAIERKAHRLKGTVLYLGAKAATAAVADVEVLGRSGDLIGAARAICSMETEMTRLAEALRPYAPL